MHVLLMLPKLLTELILENYLLHKNIDITFTRLLFHMYQRQEVTARWKNTESFCFTPQNGVRQGGILSLLLCNLYIDKLINELKNRGIGCYMGHYFVGAIAYADDLYYHPVDQVSSVC